MRLPTAFFLFCIDISFSVDTLPHTCLFSAKTYISAFSSIIPGICKSYPICRYACSKVLELVARIQKIELLGELSLFQQANSRAT